MRKFMVELLKAENISKKFKGKMIFENVSFIIEKGSSYGFVGANGCGKSVLFKILCGYSIPTTGKVIYNGVEIGKDKDFIFDSFYSTKGEEGRGLGLYISQRLLERNGNSIRIASENEGILSGATFIVNFKEKE